MSDEIKDQEQINTLIDNLFSVLPVYMLVQGNKPVHIKVVTHTDKGLIIRSPETGKVGESRILSVTNDGKIYIFVFSIIGSQGGYEILRPIQVTVKKASRSTERVNMEQAKPSFRLFVSNIVKQNEISQYLTSNSFKVTNIIKTYSPKLKSKFAEANIYIQDRPDSRMRLISNYDKPIFIPDINQPNALDDSIAEDFVPYKDYKEQIRVMKSQDKGVAEIAIPLKYRDYSYIGYILVSHDMLLTKEDFDFVNQIAINIRREIYASNIVLESKETCFVADLSKKGLSFFHPPTKLYAKLFQTGEPIIFDLVFNETKKNTLRAIVRNIKPTEKEYRIGCEFHPQSEGELYYLEEFLNEQAAKDIARNKQEAQQQQEIQEQKSSNES